FLGRFRWCIRPGWRDDARTGLTRWDERVESTLAEPERGPRTMANPFAKGWRYLMALFGAKIDEYADPKVQIQQAIEDAQRQHQALTQQAAAVIGNQRQLEMKLSRNMAEVEKLQASTRQALVLSDKARADGDE